MFSHQIPSQHSFLLFYRFVHVTQDNISIVLFDSHGSTGQDENYLNSQPNWLDRQHSDYIKVAQ